MSVRICDNQENNEMYWNNVKEQSEYRLNRQEQWGVWFEHNLPFLEYFDFNFTCSCCNELQTQRCLLLPDLTPNEVAEDEVSCCTECGQNYLCEDCVMSNQTKCNECSSQQLRHDIQILSQPEMWDDF